MNILRVIALLSLLALLSGCESLGWNGCIFRDTLTPDVSQETSVHTWENGE